MGCKSNQGWKVMGGFMKYIVLLLMLLMPCALLAGDAEITVHSGWSFVNAERSFNACPFCKDLIDFTIIQSVESSPEFGIKGGYYFSNAMEIEGSFSVAPNHNIKAESPFICPPGLVCPLMFP